jgi:hypothetical protein
VLTPSESSEKSDSSEKSYPSADDKRDGNYEVQSSDEDDSDEEIKSPERPLPRKKSTTHIRGIDYEIPEGERKQPAKPKKTSNNSAKQSAKHASASTKKAPPTGKVSDRAHKNKPSRQNSEANDDDQEEYVNRNKQQRREIQAKNMRNSGDSMKSKENVQPQQPSRSELQARLEEMEQNQRKARKEMEKLQREKSHQEEEVQKLSDIVAKSTTFTEERSEHELLSEKALVKNATRSAYRQVKFLNNEAQAQNFGEKVMDNSKMTALMFTDKLTVAERAVVLRNRANFYAKYGKEIKTIVNDQRSYNQVSTSPVKILCAKHQKLDVKPTLPNLIANILLSLSHSRS